MKKRRKNEIITTIMGAAVGAAIANGGYRIILKQQEKKKEESPKEDSEVMPPERYISENEKIIDEEEIIEDEIDEVIEDEIDEVIINGEKISTVIDENEGIGTPTNNTMIFNEPEPKHSTTINTGSKLYETMAGMSPIKTVADLDEYTKVNLEGYLKRKLSDNEILDGKMLDLIKLIAIQRKYDIS